MTVWCWRCRRYCAEREFEQYTDDDTRLATGHRIKYLKHRNCKAKTIVQANMARLERVN